MLPLSRNRSKLFNCPNHIINFSKELKNLYDKGELVDIVLVAGNDGVKAQAHRIVLFVSKSNFRSKLKSKKADTEEIPIDNIDGVTLKAILDFLYSGQIELQSDTVKRVLKAADRFQIGSLFDACCDFMASDLDPCNCVDTCLFADQGNYMTLYDKSLKFVYANFESVYTEKEFLQLNKEELTKFVFGTEFCKTSTKLIFKSLVAWINHDRPNREQFSYKLLSHVSFSRLDAPFIAQNTKSISKNHKCSDLIHKWLGWHLSEKTRANYLADHTEAKTSEKLVLGNCDTDFKCQSYDPNLEMWSYEEWPHPLNNRLCYSVIVVNDKLIKVGGRIDGSSTNTAEWLDLQKMEWTQLPPMKEGRCDPGLAELNGHLYVIGGSDVFKNVRSVEVFDFTLQAWTYSEPLPSEISNIQVAVLNGLLYAGGTNISFLECYNPITLKWSKTAPMGNESECFGMAAVGQFLYTARIHRFGAYTGTPDIDRYDPRKNTWVHVKPLMLKRCFPKCVGLNNRLILKSWDPDKSITKIEEYDPEIDKWNSFTILSSDKFSNSHLFTVKNKIK